MALQSYSCVLCNLGIEETVHHLFLQCEFAKQCWQSIGVDIQALNSMHFLKDAIASRFFMESIILLCWTIWTTGNAFIFDNIQPQVSSSRTNFIKELKVLKFRVNSRSKHSFLQ
jgi:hypothetical protein